MTQTDRTFLYLIRCAVRENHDEDISLSQICWHAIIQLSKAQAITPLVIDGLQNYLFAHPDCKLSEQETSESKVRRMQWLGQMMTCERMYAQHEKTMADLANLYAQKSIRMMVLKGYGLSLDWPVPNHRPVGDLDIYNFGQWREADAWLAKACGIKANDGHEHHTVFSFEEIPVENHYDFINTKAHRDAPAIELHLKMLAEKNGKQIEVSGAKIYLPSADFNVIFLMRHMGQHFAGEHLNLRQVLDWGFFVRAHSHEVDWDSAISYLKKIGLYTFFQQINAICFDFLGFSKDVFPSIEKNEKLEKRILSDILHPEFAEEKPSSGFMPILSFKCRRWWYNRWKHPLVYKEWLFPMFLTLLWSHLRRYKTITD